MPIGDTFVSEFSKNIPHLIYNDPKGMNSVNHWQKLSLIKSQAASFGCKILSGEPLSNHTSFKVGGRCDMVIYPNSAEALSKMYSECKAIELDTYILGNGSNVLFTDRGFRGVIFIISCEMGGVSADGNKLVAGAGASLARLCQTAYDNGLTGLEFAWGIPGTVGGAVYMNAGAYGGEIKDVITEVTALDSCGKLVTFTNDMLDMGYRRSVFTDSEYVILSASFDLLIGNKEDIKAKMDDLMSRRKSKQPLEYPSAGSTFKRPEGTYAGLVIEQSGLKGYSVGGAQVSEKHANFVINKGNATAKDIIDLIAYVKKAVKEHTGYDLECEVKTIPERLGESDK